MPMSRVTITPTTIEREEMERTRQALTQDSDSEDPQTVEQASACCAECGKNRQGLDGADTSVRQSTMTEGEETEQQADTEEGAADDLLPEVMRRVEELEQRYAELAGVAEQADTNDDDEQSSPDNDDDDDDEVNIEVEAIADAVAHRLQQMDNEDDDEDEDEVNVEVEADTDEEDEDEEMHEADQEAIVQAVIAKLQGNDEEQPAKRTRQAETPTPATQEHGGDEPDQELEEIRQGFSNGDPWALHQAMESFKEGVQ